MDSTKNSKKEQALENKCPACNASISFNPKIGKWKCEYCGSSFSLEELNKNNEDNENKTIVEDDDYSDYISYQCQSCGAEIVADNETASTFCVYCGNTAILKNKLSGKFAPNLIIPFKKTKEDAILAFKNISKGRPLMPKDFNSPANIEKIKGVYIPFWLYDINVNGDVTFHAERSHSWTSGNTRYTKTDIYKLTRGGVMDFTKIPVDGSTRFDNDIMNSIEPFDYNEIVPYNHAYLSGFLAEKYDTEGEVIYNEAKERALNSAKDTLANSIKGYETVRQLENSLSAKETKKEYALLPVWMVNVKYKDKMHIFAMNGQTGEFIGNIPLDKTKTVIYSIIIFVISVVLGIILSYIFYNFGG